MNGWKSFLSACAAVFLPERLPGGVPVKRVRIAAGKHVVISTELAEKAARVFGTGLTRAQILDC